MFECGISPTLVTKGLKIIKLGIVEFNNSFLDSMQYMSGSLAYLAKYFRLPIQKGIFPHSLNSFDNFHLGPEMPPLEKFLENCYAKEEREAIENWYQERKKRPYNVIEELAIYCRADTEILLLLMSSFLKQWYIIQADMREYFINKTDCEERRLELKDVYFHPFGPNFCTLSSFVYALYRWYELNTYHICLLDDERGIRTIGILFYLFFSVPFP